MPSFSGRVAFVVTPLAPLAALALAAVGLVAPARAPAQTSCPQVCFVDSSALQLRLEGLRGVGWPVGALHNGRSAAAPVVVSVESLYRLTDSGAISVVPSPFVVAPLRIDAGQDARLTLSPRDSLPAGAQYVGALVVRDSAAPAASAPLTQRPLRLDLSRTFVTAANAVWQTSAVRWWPLVGWWPGATGGGFDDGSVPLGTGQLPTPTCGRPVTLVDSAHGHWLRACLEAVRAEDSTAARLRLSHVHYAGTYTGTLGGAGAVGEVVRLTVRVTDAVYLPVIVLALGIVLATLSEHYTGIGRPVLELRRRVLSLDELFSKARTEFAGARPPRTRLSIARDFAQEREALKRAIDTMSRPLAGTLNANDAGFKAVVDGAAKLELAAQQWAGFGASIADAVDAALAVAEAAAAVADPVPKTNSRLPQSVQRLVALTDRGEIDVDELAAQQTAVENQRTLLVFLAPLFLRHSRASAWVATLKANGANPGPFAQPLGVLSALPTTWADVEHKLGEVALALWDIALPAEVGERQVAATLLTVEQALVTATTPNVPAADDASTKARRSAVVRAAHAAAVEMADPRTPALARAATRRTRRIPDRVQALTIRQRIRANDWFFALLTFGVALLAWLPTNYFKQPPFGTWSDYIGAFVWGFGTNVTMSVLTGLLGKLRTLGGALGSRGNLRV